VVFVLSDFLAPGYEKGLAVTRRRHDTIAFVLDDEREEEFPNVGWIRLEDLETAEACGWTPEAGCPRGFPQGGRSPEGERDRIFKRLGVDAIRMRTGESYVKPLLAFFAARARRFR